MLAFTWGIETFAGSDAITRELIARADCIRPTGFKVAPGRAAPRQVTRIGMRTLEAFFAFETAIGHGNGVLRLTPDPQDSDKLKA